jgi:hypothetical protein
MKCFNHKDVDAVGICKNCNRGLCHDCLIDIKYGIACKNGCADEVIAVEKLIQRNINTSSKKYNMVTPVFLMLIGVLFIYTGWQDEKTRKFIIPSGLIMLAFGIIRLVTIQRANRWK